MGRKRFNVIRYNLEILKKLDKPTTIYSLIKLGYAHSTAYYLLKDYESKGLVKVSVERSNSGLGYKKVYTLSSIGKEFLRLAEKLERSSKPQSYFRNRKIS